MIGNSIDNCLKAGVQVSHRGDPLVTGNSIQNGEGGGIVVLNRCEGV